MKVSAGQYCKGWCLKAAASIICISVVISCASTTQNPQTVHRGYTSAAALEKASEPPLNYSDNDSYATANTQTSDPYYYDPWDYYYYNRFYYDYNFYDPFFYSLNSPWYYPYWYGYGPYYYEDDDDFCRHRHHRPQFRETVKDLVHRQRQRREERFDRAADFLRDRQEKRIERLGNTTEHLRDIVRSLRENREDRIERMRDAFPPFNLRQNERPELFRDRPVFTRPEPLDESPFFRREPFQGGLFRNGGRR